MTNPLVFRESDDARAVVEAAGVGLVRLDEELRVRLWNPWVARASGIPAGEALGASLAALVPEFWQAHEEDLRDVLARGDNRYFSALLHGRLLPLRGDDGAYLDHDLLVAAAPGEGGAGGLVLTARSVSEAVRAYRELERAHGELQALYARVREAQQTWQVTFDAVDELVWVLDAERRIVLGNRAFSEKVGVGAETLAGRSCAEVLGFQAPERCVAAHRAEGAEAVPCLGPDYRFHGRALAGGRLVCTAVDLRPVKGAWEETARAEKTFALVRLVTGASHELNNPLAAILGAAELGLLDCADPRVRRRLETVRTQAERAAQVVARLRRFARLGLGRREPVDLAEVVRAAVRALPTPAELALGTDLPPDLPSVLGQRGRLEALVAALLDNAIRAAGPGGRVVVGARHRPEGDRVVLWVEDDGPGFSPEVLPHVFDPFFTTREPGEGAGLGLSECLGIAEDLGGTVAASNREEGGALVQVTLPVDRPGAAHRTVSGPGLHDRMLALLSGGEEEDP
ncbi:MAG: hypothetical protein Kow0092_16800 [Deferrisomatales bacterium]